MRLQVWYNPQSSWPFLSLHYSTHMKDLGFTTGAWHRPGHFQSLFIPGYRNLWGKFFPPCNPLEGTPDHYFIQCAALILYGTKFTPISNDTRLHSHWSTNDHGFFWALLVLMFCSHKKVSHGWNTMSCLSEWIIGRKWRIDRTIFRRKSLFQSASSL